MGAGGLVEIVEADDVAGDNLVERAFDGDPAQMHDTVAARHHRVDGPWFGEIAVHPFLVGAGDISRCDVAKTDCFGKQRQSRSQGAAKRASRARDQEAFHSGLDLEHVIIQYGLTCIISCSQYLKGGPNADRRNKAGR